MAPDNSPKSSAADVSGTVRLCFQKHSREADTHVNLSALRVEGRCLWLAGDETATIERLVAGADGSEYGDQTTYRLADLVDLPGDGDAEADIEGIARSESYLWAVGSHSLKRKRIKDKHGTGKAFDRLATVAAEDNRNVLVRIPVVQDDDGLPTLVRKADQDGRSLQAALFGGRGDKSLRDLLAEDEHLGPFVSIPSKDNGLDIEGIGVNGDRVYLGMRGPVLRGWAVLLELEPYVDADDPGRLLLRTLDDDLPYTKHLLDLDGLGIRDLCPHGDDLLVLAGPTMDLDGPVRVYRWHGAGKVQEGTVVRDDDLTLEVALPHGERADHAEGIVVLDPDDDGGQRLLVVYDSPAPERLDGGCVTADVVRLPG